MAKLPFKFKLEALLKVRKIKEEKIKIALGLINQKIFNSKNIIIKLKEDIDKAYESQDEFIRELIDVKTAQFFPIYIRTNNEKIKQEEAMLLKYQNEYNEKLRELKQAMADTKVIQKMKDKEFEKYKKELTKKMYNEIEEQFIISNSHIDQRKV